jgi:amidase
MAWRDIVAKKRESLANSIPEEWRNSNLRNDMISDGYVNTSDYLDSILPEEENNITKKTIIELSKLISLGKLSSVEVTTAFAHRAMLAHQILNCCSEIFIDRALERASELENYFQNTGKTVGILHGIPISLKDQVDLIDLPSSIGYVSKAFEKKTQNSLLAEKLLELGAIFYVKTCMAYVSAKITAVFTGTTYVRIIPVITKRMGFIKAALRILLSTKCNHNAATIFFSSIVKH